MKQNPDIQFGFFPLEIGVNENQPKTTDKITSPSTKYTEVTAVLKELILRGSKRILDQISSEWKKYLNPVLCNIKDFLSYNTTYAQLHQVEIESKPKKLLKPRIQDDSLIKTTDYRFQLRKPTFKCLYLTLKSAA